MAKAPKNPEEIVEAFVADLKAAFGEDLLSVVLYGSAVRGDYRPSRSDINFFVVLTPTGIRDIEKAMPTVRKWRKRYVAVPRFVTEEYIERSLDSFPIEFLGMQRFHKTVYGRDFLQQLAIGRDDLRLQCERELKGKLLHLREGFIATNGKRKALESLVSVSLPTFASLFEAMLYLRGKEAPLQRVHLFQETAELFGLDRGIFGKLVAVRQGKTRLSEEELRNLCKQYMAQIERAAEVVDTL